MLTDSKETPQGVRWAGRAAQNREADGCCPGPHLQVGSVSLGLRNSLWGLPGLSQDSLLKLGIPLEEGLIDLEGWKEQFRMWKGRLNRSACSSFIMLGFPEPRAPQLRHRHTVCAHYPPSPPCTASHSKALCLCCPCSWAARTFCKQEARLQCSSPPLLPSPPPPFPFHRCRSQEHPLTTSPRLSEVHGGSAGLSSLTWLHSPHRLLQASTGALVPSTLPAYRRHSINAHQANEWQGWEEGRLSSVSKKQGPTEDVRPGFLTECWKIPAWSWAHDGAVDYSKDPGPPPLTPRLALHDWLLMDVHGKWLMCLGVGTGVQEPSSDFGFGGQSRAVPQVTDKALWYMSGWRSSPRRQRTGQTDHMGGRSPCGPVLLPPERAEAGKTPLLSRVSGRPPSNPRFPHGAVQGAGLLGSEAFVFLSRPTLRCPQACPTSSPYVPVLSLTLTGPHLKNETKGPKPPMSLKTGNILTSLFHHPQPSQCPNRFQRHLPPSMDLPWKARCKVTDLASRETMSCKLPTPEGVGTEAVLTTECLARRGRGPSTGPATSTYLTGEGDPQWALSMQAWHT
ncbi:hypothetical protein Cadr_000020131 [Camelus dromedarius]|uniref:Uncharacterized protein n=1 Tax=Camelus dromedarius TaxID=9838 RepID=A0A5N4CZC8_CAMDR|nr:hypothetical protein Cadr_000020131 [Camelus dromedarius]